MEVELVESTDDPGVDEALRKVIALFEGRFPGRIIGYYLTGSYATKTSRSASDIDVTLLFRGGFMDEGEQRASIQAAKECIAFDAREVDIAPLPEQIFYPMRIAILKLHSRLVYGEDIRDSIPMPTATEYSGHISDLAGRLLTRLGRKQVGLKYPLQYPDPTGEFYGYDRPRSHDADKNARSMKDFTLGVSYAASAITALKGGPIIGDKTECLPVYESVVHDEWVPFVRAIFTRCMGTWECDIPQDEGGRLELRQICHQALGFENYFMDIYRDFLVGYGGIENAARRAEVLRDVFGVEV